MSLEPFLSQRTLEIMTKYIVVQSEKEIENINIEKEDIIMTYQNGKEKNNACCIYNFSLFIPCLKYSTTVNIPNEDSQFAKIIIESYPTNNYVDSFTQLYNDMNKKAMALDSPGWLYLTYNTKRKKLYVCTLELHDNPLCYNNEGHLRIPLFAWDLWEHAYFLQYEYRKSSYVKALWYITNWEVIEKRFELVIKNEKPLSLSDLS